MRTGPFAILSFGGVAVAAGVLFATLAPWPQWISGGVRPIATARPAYSVDDWEAGRPVLGVVQRSPADHCQIFVTARDRYNYLPPLIARVEKCSSSEDGR